MGDKFVAVDDEFEEYRVTGGFRTKSQDVR